MAFGGTFGGGVVLWFGENSSAIGAFCMLGSLLIYGLSKLFDAYLKWKQAKKGFKLP